MTPTKDKPEPPKVAEGSHVVCFLGKGTSQYMTMREEPGPDHTIGKVIPNPERKGRLTCLKVHLLVTKWANSKLNDVHGLLPQPKTHGSQDCKRKPVARL